jgi:hypothetical protein
LFNANQSVDGDPQRLEAAQHIVQDRLLFQDREAPDITEKPWCASFWPAPNGELWLAATGYTGRGDAKIHSRPRAL